MASKLKVETVHFIGEGGTDGTLAHVDNGGGCTLAVSGTPLNHFDVNGGPTSASAAWGGAQIACATTDNGSSKVRVTLTDAFASCVVGSIVNFSGGVYTVGRYECIAVDGSGHYVDLELAYIANGSCDVKVGGCFPATTAGLQDMLDDADLDAIDIVAGVNNRYVWINTTITLTSTIDLDVNSGGGETGRIYVQGRNAAFTADTEIEITTSSTLANGLFDFTGVDYMTFKDIELDGGGVGKAEYCIKNDSDTSNYNILINCRLHNADNHGVIIGVSGVYYTGWSFINCEVYDNGAGGTGSGISGRSTARGPVTLKGCSLHDNASDGVMAGGVSSITNTVAYDNGGVGISLEASADYSILSGITIYGNTGAGLRVDAVAINVYIFNVSSSGNTGVGYDFDGVVTLAYFGFNHSHGNSAHYSEGADGTFAAFRNGNNQIGDPLFTSVVDSSENFLPTTGSPLIDNGLDAMDAGQQDIGAIQSAGGGAGSSRRPRIRLHGD